MAQSFGALPDEPSQVFGGNKSIAAGLVISHSALSEHWNVLSHCHARKVATGRWLCFEHTSGAKNLSGILTEPLLRHVMKTVVKPLLARKGGMVDAPNPD